MKSILKTKKGKILLVSVSALLIALLVVGGLRYNEYRHFFCQYAKPFSYSEIQGEDKPILVAHRGAAVYAPENTLPAYRIAAQKGFTFVETDVRVTSDGIWVLSHDANLKRMTGVNLVVEETPKFEVCKPPVMKGGHAREFAGNTTPTLEEFLSLCKKESLIPVIEIKTMATQYPDAPYTDIVKSLQKFSLKDKAIIISFDADALQIIRDYDAGIQMQLLLKELTEANITKAEQLGNCGIDCAYKSLLKNRDLVLLAQQNGMVINAWTVDKRSAVQALTDLGVDFITTNAVYESVD